MNSKVEAFSPDWVSPPGDTILDLMEERDWSQTELANRLGFSSKHLNQLIKGKVSLTYEAALKLERVFGSTVSFWMNRESKYRQQMAKLEAQEMYSKWVDWLDKLPLSDFKRLGVIEDKRISEKSKPLLVEQLLTFFGVASPDDWVNHYGSMNLSFRRSKENQADVGAIASWLRLGEKVAENIFAPKYNRAKFEKAVYKIRELTVLRSDEFGPIIDELCLHSGVKLILVDSIKKAHVSGVARWLNNHSPIIQLSLYGKTNDKFWFTFFHEAAHILFHSAEKKAIFLDDMDFNQNSREEEEANEWARNILIPESYELDLKCLKYKTEILDFSNRVSVHPGIVVGRLQYDGSINYNTALNKLKTSFDISKQ
ncbi:MAG: ImmA/IrrE family metallo-endopeptidase [Candidatus Thiodiazotropha lotti]